MEHWYVYYKLSPAQLQSWLPRTERLFGAVQAACGVRGRLVRRTDEPAGIITLMEVYEDIADPAAFGAALDRALDEALAQDGPYDRASRRTERFRDVHDRDARANC